MIIVSGWLRVQEHERAAYLDGCVDVVRPAREAPGCHDFAISADPVDADRINVYERWASGDDVERFRGSGPDSDQQVQIQDAEVLRHEISSTGPP